MRIKPTIKYASLQDSGNAEIKLTTRFEINKDSASILILSDDTNFFSIKIVDVFCDAEIY